jgi:hypothetical protein
LRYHAMPLPAAQHVVAHGSQRHHSCRDRDAARRGEARRHGWPHRRPSVGGRKISRFTAPAGLHGTPSPEEGANLFPTPYADPLLAAAAACCLLLSSGYQRDSKQHTQWSKWPPHLSKKQRQSEAQSTTSAGG